MLKLSSVQRLRALRVLLPTILILSSIDCAHANPFQDIEAWQREEIVQLKKQLQNLPAKEAAEETEKRKIFVNRKKDLLDSYVKQNRSLSEEYFKVVNGVKIKEKKDLAATDGELEACAEIVKNFKMTMAEIGMFKRMAEVDEDRKAYLDKSYSADKGNLNDYYKEKYVTSLKQQLSKLWDKHETFPYNEATKKLFDTLGDARLLFNDEALTEERISAEMQAPESAPAPLCQEKEEDGSLSKLILKIAAEIHKDNLGNQKKILTNEKFRKLGYTHIPVSGNQYLCWMRSTFFDIFHKLKDEPDVLRDKLLVLKNRTTNEKIKSAIALLLKDYESPNCMLKVILSSKQHLLNGGRFPEVVEEILRLIGNEILAPTEFAERDKHLARRKEILKSLYHPTSSGDTEMMQKIEDYFFAKDDVRGRMLIKDSTNFLENAEGNGAPHVHRIVRNPKGEIILHADFEIPVDYGTMVVHAQLDQHNKNEMGVLIDAQGGHFELEIQNGLNTGNVVDLARPPLKDIFVADPELRQYALDRLAMIKANNFSEVPAPALVKAAAKEEDKELKRELDRIEGFGSYVDKISKYKTEREIEVEVEEEPSKSRLINAVMGRKYYNLLKTFAEESKNRISRGEQPDQREKGRIDGFRATLVRVYEKDNEKEITDIIGGEKPRLINAVMGRKYYNLLLERAEERLKILRSSASK